MLLISSTILVFLLGQPTVFGQKVSSTSSSTSSTIAPLTDPTTGGRPGNAGAQIHVASKTIWAVTTYAMDSITATIRNISIPDITFPVFFDVLTIKSLRVNEAKFANLQNQYFIPNRIQTRLYGGRIVATGVWNYKPAGEKPESKGTFRATVVNGEIKVMNQLARTYEAKPIVQTVECRVDFRQFRADIEGAPPGMSVIENCTNPICNKIRSHFEDIVCNIVRNFIKETINRPLATIPNRVMLSCSNQFFVDYGLMTSEPKVTAAPCIRAGLEGRVLWRNTSSPVPFSPHDFQPPTNKTMIIFDLGDYVFNTLLHQAHSQSYRFSAIDLLSSTSPLQDSLKFKCTGRPCLGSILSNSTTYGFPDSARGDLVYKSMQRPMRVFVQGSRGSNFDGSNGVLEIYGPPSSRYQSGRRPLLAQVDVGLFRGDFSPILKGNKLSGSIKLTQLQFKTSSTSHALVQDWQAKFVGTASPILHEVFNNFLNQVARFPIPLPAGYECTSPQFTTLSRSMRIECDVRFTGVQNVQVCK